MKPSKRKEFPAMSSTEKEYNNPIETKGFSGYVSYGTGV